MISRLIHVGGGEKSASSQLQLSVQMSKSTYISQSLLLFTMCENEEPLFKSATIASSHTRMESTTRNPKGTEGNS